MKAESSVVVDRPIEAVWAYVADLANTSVLNPAAVEARLTSAGPLQQGSTYVWVGQAMGRRMETNAEITEFEPNRKWSYRSTSGTASAGSIILEPAAGGTRLTLRGQTEMGGLLRLAEPLLARFVKRNLDTGLANVKRVLEAQG